MNIQTDGQWIFATFFFDQLDDDMQQLCRLEETKVKVRAYFFTSDIMKLKGRPGSLREFNGRTELKRKLKDWSLIDAFVDFEVFQVGKSENAYMWGVKYGDLQTCRFWHKSKLGKKLNRWIHSCQGARNSLKILFVWHADPDYPDLTFEAAFEKFKANVKLELSSNADKYDKENIVMLSDCLHCGEIGSVGKQFVNVHQISLEERCCRKCFDEYLVELGGWRF